MLNSASPLTREACGVACCAYGTKCAFGGQTGSVLQIEALRRLVEEGQSVLEGLHTLMSRALFLHTLF